MLLALVAFTGSVRCVLPAIFLMVDIMVSNASLAGSERLERSVSYVGTSEEVASRVNSWATFSSLRAGNFACRSFSLVACFW